MSWGWGCFRLFSRPSNKKKRKWWEKEWRRGLKNYLNRLSGLVNKEIKNRMGEEKELDN